MNGIDQINRYCQKNYGEFKVDSWGNDRDGYEIGYFQVTIQAHSSAGQIAYLFDRIVNQQGVKSFPELPDCLFMATKILIDAEDVEIDAPEARIYGFHLVGEKLNLRNS